jgi:hypothetical protein
VNAASATLAQASAEHEFQVERPQFAAFGTERIACSTSASFAPQSFRRPLEDTGHSVTDAGTV